MWTAAGLLIATCAVGGIAGRAGGPFRFRPS